MRDHELLAIVAAPIFAEYMREDRERVTGRSEEDLRLYAISDARALIEECRLQTSKK